MRVVLERLEDRALGLRKRPRRCVGRLGQRPAERLHEEVVRVLAEREGARLAGRADHAAGGALPTGQRIGSALGTALVMSVYQVTVTASGSTATALRVALGTALVLIVLALVVAVRDLRHASRVSPR